MKASLLEERMGPLLESLSKKLIPAPSGNHVKVRDALLDLAKQALKSAELRRAIHAARSERKAGASEGK